MKKLNSIIFSIAGWSLKLFEKAFQTLLALFVFIFFIELLYKMPFIKDIQTSTPPADTIAIANTYIVYVTFIVVIGTVGLTLAGLYFQKSIAKREGEILNENLEKIIKALETNEQGFRDNFVEQLLESKNIKPLIQEKLDNRVALLKNELELQSSSIEATKKAIKELAKAVEDSRHFDAPPIENITFTIAKRKD